MIALKNEQEGPVQQVSLGSALRWLAPLALHATVVGVVMAVNKNSLFAYGFSLGIAFAVYGMVFRRIRPEIATLFGLYALAAMALYGLQYATLPEFKGFSGGSGIGTDDCRFFVAAMEPGALELPGNHCYTVARTSPYAILLRNLVPGPIVHPFDALFPNVLALCFVPLFTRKLALAVGAGPSAARFSFLLSAACPFVLANGLVLIRDGWTAALLAGALAFLLERRYAFAGLLAALLFWLRPGTAALLLTAGVLLLPFRKGTGKVGASEAALRNFAFYGVLAIGLAVVLPLLLAYATNQGVGGDLFRDEFAQGFLSAAEDSTFSRIQALPAVLRMPIGFAFFLFAPFLSVASFEKGGIVIPRSILAGGIMPLVSIAYFFFMTNGLLEAKRQGNRALLALGFSFLLLVFVLSQASLQFRHKTAIMPLFYVLVAWGIANPPARGLLAGQAVAALLITVNILAVILDVL